MGFEPQQARLKLESVNEFTDRMTKGLKEMKAALAKARDKYVMYYNRQREPAAILAPGDKVWRPTDHRQNCLTIDLVLLPSKLALDMERIVLRYHRNFDNYILSSQW
jgi:hypothetical protein